MKDYKLFPLSALFFVGLMNAQNTKQDSLHKDKNVDEVIITGTLKPISKSKSPVPVEIYTKKFFEKNPTSNLLESISMVNGIRSQINCSVCNTGDIHINGLEGPYSLILIDGMPIVSSLSTVYGLSGIPSSMIERIEIVKGPASSVYGTEAMGGTINIITKNALTAPKFASDFSTTSWGEQNMDLATKFNAGKKAASILSVNYFNFTNRIDKNKDGFMDTTLQDRVSVFNKWNFKRKDNRMASFMARYLYEDRLGGQLQWQKQHRGGDEVYGESIYTNRFEAIGLYQLPTVEQLFLQLSFNYHHQNSRYGTEAFDATQRTSFGQFYWNRNFGKHDLIAGATLRHNYYDDSTIGTQNTDGTNNPTSDWLPGLFVQDQWTFNDKHSLLLGYRLDHSKNHGFIHSPRLAYKLSPSPATSIRASFGTGFRVVNVFTEDHKSLTNARETVIRDIKPEKSINGNINFTQKITAGNGYIDIDALAFYSYFTNKIVADTETDSDKIIYDNLKGHAISQGISLGANIKFGIPLSLNIGATYMDVFEKYEEGGETHKKYEQLAPKWSGTYALSYEFSRKFGVDFTGEVYGPMRLITVPKDFRPEYSPWYSLANIQLRTKFDNGLEIYGGVKNLFNFTPKDPILRPFDPFDKDTGTNNPNGYEFEPSYGYAPMQKIRGFLGIRYTIK